MTEPARTPAPAKHPRLLAPALIYTATNVLAAAVPFLLLPILTRMLSPAEYGRVTMFAVVVPIIGAFIGLNAQTSIGVRYSSPDRGDLDRYVATCASIVFWSGAIILFGVWTLSSWLEPVTSLPARWLAMAAAVATGLSVIQIRLTLWQCSGDPWLFGALRVGHALLDGALSLLFVVVLSYGWEGRTAGITTAAVVVAAVSLFLLRQSAFPLRFDSSDARRALRFGMPLIPHMLGGMLIAMTDRMLITGLLDVASAGIYAVAVMVGSVLGMAADAFNKAYTPWLLQTLHRSEPRRDRAIVRFTYLYFIAVAAAALTLALAAPTLLGLLVGEHFRAAAPVVPYIAFGFAFGGMYFMVTNYVFFAHRTASLAMVTIGCGIMNVVLCYALVRVNGLVGAAQAFMIAQALLFLATWWLAHQARPMPWREALIAKA